MGRVLKFENRRVKEANQGHAGCERDSLIARHIETAVKLSKQILKAWGVRLSVDEIESAAGIGLCEAAKRYKPVQGAKFTTYLHYFLKGSLAESIGFQCSCVDSLKSGAEGEEALSTSESNEIFEMSELKSNTDIDHEVFVREIRKGCNAAIGSLSMLEKLVVFRVNVLGYKVANLAREMGYSRGYLSEVRSKAERMLREKLEYLREVA